MNKAITITSVLLLALIASCRKPNTDNPVADDTPDESASGGIVSPATELAEAAASAEILELKVRRLTECLSLLAKAREADHTDAEAALAAWDKAHEGLQKCKMHIADDKFEEMASEVSTARKKILRTIALRDTLDRMQRARESGDANRVLRTVEEATTRPGIPPRLTERWTRELKEIREKRDYAKIIELMSAGKNQDASDALEDFIKKYPENKRGKVILKVLKKKIILLTLQKEAEALFEQKKWAETLVKLEELKRQSTGRGRPLYLMIRTCKYELELIKFNKAVEANKYEAAISTGEVIDTIDPDRYATDIEPKVQEMRAKRKLAETLARGAKALKSGQYREARQIVKHLKGSYPEADEIVRRSRYLDAMAKGDAARKEGDAKTALAMYKIARRYAKGPAEHKEIDALIDAIDSDK